MSRRWFNWFDFLFAIDKFLYVPYEMYAIQYSCYQSYFEIRDLLVAYWKFTKNASVIGFNVFYSGGPIYKSIVNLIMFFWAKEYTRVQNAFAFGMELGQIFWMTFYPVEDYLEMALKTGAVWGQDYTWDQVINLEVDDGVERTIQVIGSFGTNDDPNQQTVSPRSEPPVPIDLLDDTSVIATEIESN